MLRTSERFIVFLVLFFCASLAHAANCSNTNLSNGVICVQSSYTSNGGALQTVSATLNGVSASNVITIESHFCNGGPCSSTIVDTQTVADTGTSTCTKSSHSPLTLSNQRYYAWICTGLSSGTHTITLTTSGGDTTFYMDIHLAEWSGLN